MQIDPVDGGTDNSYSYTNDAVNQYDLSGEWIPLAIHLCIRFCAKAIKLGAKVYKGYKNYQKARKKVYTVYKGRDASNKVRYVGITKRKPQIRYNEHKRSNTNRSGLKYRDFRRNVTYKKARKIEQKNIRKYGLQKNGGQLYNKINSIRRR